MDESVEIRRGNSRILLVAPHGGRRAPVDALNPPPNLRVNDVFTPDLTRLLAERLDATAIINETIDRNDIDLNRISQVTKRAAWFLDVLHVEIERLRQRHGVVVALFVHGWNTGQPICDLGIGGSLIDEALVVPEGAGLTVSESFRVNALQQLREECAVRRIATAVGERYAASHRNNLLQLFALERHHHVEAVQLELAIPLRMPGEWRDRFLDACVATFTVPQRVRSPFEIPSRRDESAPLSLQFYDPRAAVGLFTGTGRLGAMLGGRLLLFLGEKRIALFTGEAAVRGGRSLLPLRLTGQGSEVDLSFDGPMLFLEDGADYLDLEAAFGRSRLIHAEVEIHFTASVGEAAQLGHCVGRLRADGNEHIIEANGFANAGAWRGSGAHEQTMLSAAFANGAGELVRYDHSRDEFLEMRFSPAGVTTGTNGRVEITPEEDPYVPQSLALHADDAAPMRVVPLSRMSILRTAGGGAARVTFGVARFEAERGDGFGVFEYTRPIGAPSGQRKAP